MKKEQLKHFKQLLLARKSEILSSVTEEEREGREAVTVDAKDYADAASESYGQEFYFAISDAGRRMLRDIDDALRRIEDGSFGTCEGCEKAIDMPRLEAIPHAKLCISCQELAEKEKNHP